MPNSQNEPSPPYVPENELEFDHPLYRRAPAISAGVGIVAALAVAFFTNAPWWMPIIAFAVTASVLFRILRPRFRHPSIEDEI